MADTPTTSDLIKTEAITIDAVDALIMAYGAHRGAGPLPLGEGYTLDVDAAIYAHSPTARAMADPDRTEWYKRKMLRTAILLARPVKA